MLLVGTSQEWAVEVAAFEEYFALVDSHELVEDCYYCYSTEEHEMVCIGT